MENVRFIEKEQDNEFVIYWFDVNDEKIGVIESELFDGLVIDKNKEAIDSHVAQGLPNMVDFITEEMRRG
ncbi:MAG: hypothetical protein JSU85_01115 [Candidatus Zixiibacteriota bacterium]|nr:MAG: hypothetical protein JSU85_01115 [candidate division Zixibacteria bacterium]